MMMLLVSSLLIFSCNDSTGPQYAGESDSRRAKSEASEDASPSTTVPNENDTTQGPNNTPDQEGNKEGTDADIEINGGIKPPEKDQRTPTQLLCQEGPKLTKFAGKGNLQEEFSYLCSGDDASPLLERLQGLAYSGTGSPHVEIISTDSPQDDAINMIMAFAVKIPGTPESVGGSVVHNAFVVGIKEAESIADVAVTSRTAFPGRKSAEEVHLTYNVSQADGREVTYIRKTEVNSYILSESNRDVSLTTEFLEGPNDAYTLANGLTATIKLNSKESLILMVANYQMIDQRDTEAIVTTTADITRGCSRLIYSYYSK